MPSVLSAGSPLEPPRHRVGRSGAVLVDGTRADRLVPVDAWYPATGPALPHSVYELLPGIGFTATAEQEPAIADGPHPVVLWSHGRTGTRSSYALLCEALAARGYVVVSPEHAGDSLTDWMLGAAVDDATNEANRVADARFVLDSVLDAGALPAIAGRLDATRVAVAGHSYGGFTALAVASGETRDPRVRAVAGLQSFTRTLPKQVFEAIEAPTLLLVGAKDATTPPDSDADRAWAKLAARPAWRVDVERAGHQACSDVGLYLELAPRIEGLPDLVRDYVATMAADVTGTAGDPWRATVALSVRVLAAFLDGALAIDPSTATAELAAVAALPGIQVSNRGAFDALPTGPS